MNDTKFAECECSAADEDWEHTGRLTLIDENSGEGVEMVEFMCQTCETRYKTDLPAKRV